MKQRIFSGLSRRLPQPRRANNHNRLFQSPRRAWTLSLVALAATLLFGVGLLRNTRAAFATTYFVRTDGSNATCNGLTNASAASAPNCAFLTIQQAITTASAGDTINVAAGLYTQATAITVNKSLTILGAQAGVDPRPSAGTMRVIGSASEAIIDGNGLSNAFSIQASDVTIDGFDIKNATTALVDSLGASVFNNAKVRYNIIHNASTAGGAKGVRLTAMTDSTVEYNNLFVVADSGIELGAAAAGASTDALVQYNEVHDLGSAGSTNSAIYAFATGSAATAINATIRGNLVYNHFGNDAIKIGAKGGQDRLLPGGTLEDNIVHDTAQDGITIDTANTTVQRNEVYRSFSSNGAIYVEHGDNNVQVLNNYIHDNAAGLAAILVGFSGRPASPTNNVVKQNSLVNNTNNFVFFRDNTGGTATLDASGNWYGSSSQATVTASVKSSAGAVTTTNRIDFTPWLNSGTDSNSMTPGFQPDLLSLTVAPSTVSLQTGATGRLQEAVNLAATNASITMLSGTYVEDLNVNKNVTISGGGTVNGKISGTAGNFTATATLSLGDGSTTGVSMSTSLNTGGNMVTLLDSDAANLNGVTTVGSGGTLIAANGLSVGGTLNGTGTVSGPTTVLNGGHVAPGLSPGVLNSDSVTFNAGSSLDVELNGTTVGSQYDQLNVTGSVTLNNPTLNLNFGFMPVFGTSFTIINNDGGDAVTGTFNGLPEGAVFVAGSVPVKISYVGGSSNDVVLTVMCAALTLNPASPLPNGTAGTPYAPVTFTASGAFGGTAAFSVVMGAPPPGMTLSPGGVLSGTPTQTGTFNFKVMATDSLGCSGMKDYALTINCQTIVINPDSPLPNGQTGVGYSQTLTANGIGTTTFSLDSGALPTGLTLSPAGVIAGTPTVANTFNFAVKAVDTNGCMNTKAYAITIGCPTLTLNSLPSGTYATPYNQTLTANPAGGGYTFSGTAPAGLTLASNGQLSGTPNAVGTFTLVRRSKLNPRPSL